MSQENKQAEPIKKYYIAYFDLLGYKDFFQNHSNKVVDFLSTIHEAISITKKYIQDVNSSPVGAELGKLSIQVKMFSDNILLCLETSTVKEEYPRLLAFLSIVADIQRNFILRYDLFLRGGITIGDLSVNENYIFGQGLIDAVSLEETAIYPRIMISQTVLGYVSQFHFVKEDDLKKACDIEDRAHSGVEISDEELAFCNAILPAVNMEKFYLQWRNNLLLPMFDGTVALNYLYWIDVNSMCDQVAITKMMEFLKAFSPEDYQRLNNLSPDHRQRLEQHKAHIIPKIREFGKYDDLDISKIKDASAREQILKKYLWVLTFHNYVCAVYDIPDCKINSGCTCDLRFMRITVEIFEDSSNDGNAAEGNDKGNK